MSQDKLFSVIKTRVYFHMHILCVLEQKTFFIPQIPKLLVFNLVCVARQCCFWLQNKKGCKSHAQLVYCDIADL